MILVFKGGDCIAAGPATSRGSELKYIGDRQTPKYTVSIRVKNEKREDGTWASEYLDCCVWREAAENMPEIGKGELVFAVGKLQSRKWVNNAGEEKTVNELTCDYLASASASGEAPYKPVIDAIPISAADDVGAVFSELEEADGELPF